MLDHVVVGLCRSIGTVDISINNFYPPEWRCVSVLKDRCIVILHHLKYMFSIMDALGLFLKIGSIGICTEILQWFPTFNCISISFIGDLG